MPEPNSFKIVSFSTASAFDPAQIDSAKNIKKTVEKAAQVPEGAYQVYFKPETGEYFYVSA